MSKRRDLSPKRHPLVAIILFLSSTVMFLSGFILGSIISTKLLTPIIESLIRHLDLENEAIIDSITGAFIGVFGAINGVLFAYFIVFGRRLNARKAKEILERDTRLPILFLRSFQDETTNYASRLYETTLTNIFKKLGTVVALGRPYEKLSPLGAARMYFDYDEWQNAVLDLIKQSSIVIIQSAITPSLLWEVSQVIRYVRPERLLFSFISNERYEEFRTQVNDLFPYPLPDPVNKVMFLHFQSDWTPVLLYPPHKRWYNWWELSVFNPTIFGLLASKSTRLRLSNSAIKVSIKPFFEKLGIPLQATDVYIKRLGFWGCLSPLIFLGLLLIITEIMVLIIRLLQ